MPATIPAHPAAVLPLKLWRPRWFDGVALVAGAAAPDVGYLSTGIGPGVRSHAWHSLLWWSLPVALLLSNLLRRAAPVVAAHLPDLRALAPRDYGVLGTVRRPLPVSAGSALLGALSHLVWDTFTHPYVLIGHPFMGDDTYVPALRHVAVAGLPWWRVIQLISEPVGAAVVLAVAVHIGRNRLLVAWHGPPPPPVARRPTVFWLAAAGTTAVVVAVALALPGNDQGPNVLGVRVIAAIVIGLAAAAFWPGMHRVRPIDRCDDANESLRWPS